MIADGHYYPGEIVWCRVVRHTDAGLQVLLENADPGTISRDEMTWDTGAQADSSLWPSAGSVIRVCVLACAEPNRTAVSARYGEVMKCTIELDEGSETMVQSFNGLKGHIRRTPFLKFKDRAMRSSQVQPAGTAPDPAGAVSHAAPRIGDGRLIADLWITADDCRKKIAEIWAARSYFADTNAERI